jgi:hypothetical protein
MPIDESIIPNVASPIPSVLFCLIENIEIIPIINPEIEARKASPKTNIKDNWTIGENLTLRGSIHNKIGSKEIKPKIKLVIANPLFIGIKHFLNL